MGLSTQTFDILTRIAIGNGSLVYKAVDKVSLRQVALKLLTKDTDLDHKFDVDALFEAIPQIRQITGNHVCQLLDAFHDDDGPILVYEYAAGMNGAEYPHAKKLSAAQAVDVAAQLISALRSGERQRVPHGDIKPSNVIIVDTPDGRPFVFVLDWGLATFRTESTQDSLPYLAPERLQGGGVSHQADIFAAGALLFHLLTGKVLAMGANPEELAQGWAKAKPEVLAELRPDLPAKFVQWVTSLLALDPQKRPASAVDANAALGAFNPPPPLAPAEAIRPRPLSASQRAMANAPASGVFAPPQSRVTAPPISSVSRPPGSGVRSAPQVVAMPAPALAAVPVSHPEPVAVPAAMPSVPVAFAAPSAQVTSSSGAHPAVASTSSRKAMTTSPRKTPVVFLLCLFAIAAAMAGAGVWWFTRKPKSETAEAFVPGTPKHRVLEMQANSSSRSSSPNAGASIAVAKPPADAKPSAPSSKTTSKPTVAAKPTSTSAKPPAGHSGAVRSTAAPVLAKPASLGKTLAEETFTYEEGDAFLSSPAGEGWSGGWKVAGAEVEKLSLAYDSHPQRGGRLLMPAGDAVRTASRVLGPATKSIPSGAREALWYFAIIIQHGDGTPAAGGEARIFPLDPSGENSGFQIVVADTGPQLSISIPGATASTVVADDKKPIFLTCRFDWINPKEGKWDFTASLAVNPRMSAKTFSEAGNRIVLTTKGSVLPAETGVLVRKPAGAAKTRVDEVRYEPHWVNVVFKK